MSHYATLSKQPGRIQIDPAAHGDPFYRYKMRQLTVAVVGKGKMIRTYLANIDDVANDLQIKPEYLVNFLSLKLGANGSYSAKHQKQQRAFVSGSHSAERISELVVLFLQQFILCGKCTLPELTLFAERRVFLSCRSCGWKADIDSLKQLPPRFCQFVKTHASKASANEKSKAEAGERREGENDTAGGEDFWEEDDADDGIWFSDCSDAAREQRAKEMIPAPLQCFFAGAAPPATEKNKE